MNVIVISLKDEFYAHSDALIGVCPDNANGKKQSQGILFLFRIRKVVCIQVTQPYS